MAQLALLGHAKAKSKKNKARISKALRDHTVANTWWEPLSLPDWLTEQCYMQQIQPATEDDQSPGNIGGAARFKTVRRARTSGSTSTAQTSLADTRQISKLVSSFLQDFDWRRDF
jgi:hypothetical protein